MKNFLLYMTLLLLNVCSIYGSGLDYHNNIKHLEQKQTTSKESKEHWNRLAKEDIVSAENFRVDKKAIAKNVIFFLGDGMGISVVTAGRIFKGQQKSMPGEEGWLNFDRFPHLALLKTYNTDRQVPDSAATATAFLCGVKARMMTIGVDNSVIASNCASYTPSAAVQSIAQLSKEMGKSVGLVTTTTITHATPAAAYAKTASRWWEDDTLRNKDVSDINLRKKCPDNAKQMMTNAKDFDVIMGGGYKRFIPKHEQGKRGYNGTRSDGENLIETWKQYQKEKQRKYEVVQNREELFKINPSNTDALLGLVASGHLSYEERRNKTLEPSLAEMTDVAIRMLSRNSKGFFLLVEGGRIDHGQHAGKPKLTLMDMLAFDEAVGKALSMTSEKDTLTVVTADHSHVFTLGGYSTRGNPILGFSDGSTADDGMPHTTLGYQNGPGGTAFKPRRNLTGANTDAYDFMPPAAVPMSSETHGGEDIAAYAQGPGAWLFHRTHEQSYVAHAMMYASCVGDYKSESRCFNSGSKLLASLSAVLLLLLFTAIHNFKNINL